MIGFKNKKRLILSSPLILIFGVLLSIALSFYLLYHQTLADTKSQLIEMCSAQARIYEAVAKYDAFFSSRPLTGSAKAATLSQIKESHRNYAGFGETGELVLAELRGNQIHFLLPARETDFNIPDPVDVKGNLATPMRLALNGESGFTEGIDHAGNSVYAAFEYLPFMEMGLVVKINKSELVGPFLRNGMICLLAGVLIIGFGIVVNYQSVKPLVDQVFNYNKELNSSKQQYQKLVSSIPGAVYHKKYGTGFTTVFMSDPIEKISGFRAADFIDDRVRSYESIIHPDDRQIFKRASEQYLKSGTSYLLEYRIITANEEIKWINDQGSITSDENNGVSLTGVLVDITDRKLAEDHLSELSRKLSKYLSPQVYKSIFHGTQDVKIGCSRKRLTVFFSDIVGFTDATDNLEPEDLSFMINSYLNSMAEIAVKHGGTLDKFIGDGILIFFGDPESKGIREDALACVEMARDMHLQMNTLMETWRSKGLDYPMQIRMGMSSGYCTVGNFGSESRMDYTVIGRVVNIASRLENLADEGKLLISHDSYILIRDSYTCIDKGAVKVKGLEKEISVHEIDFDS